MGKMIVCCWFFLKVKTNQTDCSLNEPTSAVSTNTVMACATYFFTLVALLWMYEKFILHVKISFDNWNIEFEDILVT